MLAVPSAHVHIDVHGVSAVVTLSQPARFNAMSRAMWDQLRAVFVRIRDDPQLRCVVVRGAAGNFCAGGDIAEYPGFRFSTAQLRHFHEDTVWGALQALLDCDIPVLARIDGNCMGAGLEIASCCDIRIAGDSARFGAPIGRLGFPMAPRELDLVVRAVGVTAARAVLFEAAVFEAPRMLQLGFLTRCVADAGLDDAVAQSLQQITALAPQAARMNKRMLRSLGTAACGVGESGPAGAIAGAGASQSLLDEMVAHAYDYADTPEHREGIAAFLDRRPPRF
ncbi:MAG: enoyl-CoA hydratase/isomerase family protein [Burkholderiaceae bacterium]